MPTHAGTVRPRPRQHKGVSRAPCRHTGRRLCLKLLVDGHTQFPGFKFLAFGTAYGPWVVKWSQAKWPTVGEKLMMSARGNYP